MKTLERLFHFHEWKEIRRDKIIGYPQGMGPHWGETPTTYWVSHCACTHPDCVALKSFKINP